MRTIFELFGVLIFALCITYVICAFISGELDIRQMDALLKGSIFTLTLLASLAAHDDYMRKKGL